jgi:O-acetyl-ADP-ribose deacetylase (regulator of RNase III)
MTSIAFPSIGTGNLKIPHEVAARVMIEEVMAFSATSIRRVVFVVYEKDVQTISVSVERVS